MAGGFPTCPVCAACEDSPLSIVGNAIGILTFALAIIAAAAVRISMVMKAIDETEWMLTKVDLQRQILSSKIDEMRRRYESRPAWWSSTEARTITNTAGKAAQLQIELQRAFEGYFPGFYGSRSLLFFEILTLGIKYIWRRDHLNTLAERSDQMLSLLNESLRDAPDDIAESHTNTKLDNILQKIGALEQFSHGKQILSSEQLHQYVLPGTQEPSIYDSDLISGSLRNIAIQPVEKANMGSTP